MQKEMVILVDENDNPVGEMEKMEAHRRGRLHRAFSGFVFNDSGALLIQRRSQAKYHNPGIWANTVCSHPRPGESVLAAAGRRLPEELGFHADFAETGAFVYRAAFPNGLIEHELDHVCAAVWSGEAVRPDPAEVAEVRWITRPVLEAEIAAAPERFSFWLREILRAGILGDRF